MGIQTLNCADIQFRVSLGSFITIVVCPVCVCVWRGGEEGGGEEGGGEEGGGEEGGGGGGRGLPHYLTEEFKQHKTHFSEVRWWVYGGPNTGEDRECSESTPGTVNSV